MTKERLITEIKDNTEWLSTTNGDEVECISIENLQTILFKFLYNNEDLPNTLIKNSKDMLNFPHKQLDIFNQ